MEVVQEMMQSSSKSSTEIPEKDNALADPDGENSMSNEKMHANRTLDEDSIGIDTTNIDQTIVTEEYGKMDYPPPFRLLIITLAVVLCIFLVALDLTIIGTAIPRITDQFHSLNQGGWYGSAFFLTVAAFQPTWGKAFKYFDLKFSYLVAVFVFELGSLICGVSPSSTVLIVGRAIAGVGAAGLASGGYIIIAFSAPQRLRPVLIGIIGIAFCVASVIGPLLGGVFTENLTWRWCCETSMTTPSSAQRANSSIVYINLPIGGVAAAGILFFFSTPRLAKPLQAPFAEKINQMDLPGTFLIMAITACYLFALQWGGISKSWKSADVIETLIGFVLLSILFVTVEYYQGERALIIGRLLKHRTIAALSAYIFFASGVFFTLLYYLPIYFQTTRGDSAQQSGINNIPLVLGAGLASFVSGGLIATFGHVVPILASGSCLAAVGSGLIYSLEIESPAKEWIGYQVLLGIGIGAVFQVPTTAAQSLVEPSDLSAVSSMILFFQTIGGALWVSAGQSGFANTLIKF